MTKKEMFATIKSLLSDNAEVVEFCDHEIDLLSRKGSGSRKPTKTQQENEVFKQAMLDTMSELDAPVTISELCEQCPALEGIANQRVSALMTQLKHAGQVVRTTDKKKAYFSIATGEEDGEEE